MANEKIEAARAEAVERRKAEGREPSGTDESVQQDGITPASSGESEATGRNADGRQGDV